MTEILTMAEWKEAPVQAATAAEKWDALVALLMSPEIMIPALVLAAVALVSLLRMAIPSGRRRRRRRLDDVLGMPRADEFH